MAQYAAKTAVPMEQSRAEIEKVLSKYGAQAFGYGWEGRRAVVHFQLGNRFMRFILTLPDPQAKHFTHYKRGTISPDWVARTPDAAKKEYEQACRQSWRALKLSIHGKLEAVESGISSIEHEFMAHIVLPNGQTVGEHLAPQLEEVYATGRMPSPIAGLLPAPEDHFQK